MLLTVRIDCVHQYAMLEATCAQHCALKDKVAFLVITDASCPLLVHLDASCIHGVSCI